MTQESRTKVFFDGICHLCSKEMAIYRRLDPEGKKLELVDITSSEFNAKTYGLDEKKIHQWMHVIDAFDVVHVGVDAFLHLWKEMNLFPTLRKLVKTQPFYSLAWMWYRSFALIRPYLPKKNQCEIIS